MPNHALEITNLLYRYAELMDGGDLPAVAALFRHARVKAGEQGELRDHLNLWG